MWRSCAFPPLPQVVTTRNISRHCKYILAEAGKFPGNHWHNWKKCSGLLSLFLAGPLNPFPVILESSPYEMRHSWLSQLGVRGCFWDPVVLLGRATMHSIAPDYKEDSTPKISTAPLPLWALLTDFFIFDLSWFSNWKLTHSLMACPSSESGKIWKPYKNCFVPGIVCLVLS